MQPHLFSHHLDSVGNGTGDIDATGNYSGAIQDFLITSVGESYIHRLLISIEDSSGFKAEIYGSGSALSNGIRLLVRDDDDTELAVFTNGHVVTTNSHWAIYCYDVDVKSWRSTGSGNELLVARWTFTRMGAPLKLDAGHSLVVELNDDFMGLIHHDFIVQGTGHIR